MWYERCSKKLLRICLDLNEERCNFMTLFGPLLLSVYIWIWPWSKVWKTLKQKCLGPKFEKRYEKEVICLGYNLEVFSFQFWTWSKDGTCKQTATILEFEWGKVLFFDFVWSIIVKRLHLDLTLKQSLKDLEAEMFGS